MIRRLLVFFALLSFAIAPADGVRASDIGGGCGGYWHAPGGSRTCKFNFRGLPITVSADARVTSGTASVHIWVDIEGVSGIILYECRASGPGYAVCEDELGVGETLDERYVNFHLVCHVEGTASALYANTDKYYCQSALGF